MNMTSSGRTSCIASRCAQANSAWLNGKKALLLWYTCRLTSPTNDAMATREKGTVDQNAKRAKASAWCKAYRLDPTTPQPDPSLHLLVLLERPAFLSALENISEATLFEMVNINAQGIAFVKDPNEALQIACVTKHHSAIGGIKHPCYEARLIAVRNGGTSLRYFTEHTPELEQIAVAQSPFAIAHVKNPSPALMALAVAAAPTAIRYIENPSIAAQNLALYGSADVGVAQDANITLLAKYTDRFSAEVIDRIRPGLSFVLHFADVDNYAEKLAVINAFLASPDDAALPLPQSEATRP